MEDGHSPRDIALALILRKNMKYRLSKQVRSRRHSQEDNFDDDDDHRPFPSPSGHEGRGFQRGGSSGMFRQSPSTRMDGEAHEKGSALFQSSSRLFGGSGRGRGESRYTREDSPPRVARKPDDDDEGDRYHRPGGWGPHVRADKETVDRGHRGGWAQAPASNDVDRGHRGGWCRPVQASDGVDGGHRGGRGQEPADDDEARTFRHPWGEPVHDEEEQRAARSRRARNQANEDDDFYSFLDRPM
jgi:hypothetical protein